MKNTFIILILRFEETGSKTVGTENLEEPCAQNRNNNTNKVNLGHYLTLSGFVFLLSAFYC